MRALSMVLILTAFVRIFMGISYIHTYTYLKNTKSLAAELYRPTTIASIIICLGGFMEFCDGIRCAIHADESYQIGRCAIWGAATLAVTLASNFMQIYTGYGASWVAWTTGAAVPVLYLIGCFIRRK